MGLREDLQDLCAEIRLAGETRVSYSAAGEPIGPITPIQTIQQILAIRSHSNIQDNTEFVALFRNAVETPLPQSAILARFRARQNRFGAVQPVFIAVLIEISAHRELRDYLTSCAVSDWSVLTIREYLLTKPTLFPRELLLFLEESGRKLATPPPPREQELPDGRVVDVQDAGRHEGTLLASAAAHARRVAVSLRLTMAEAPEIAEHGDTVMAALRRLRVDPSVIETFQQANATLARPATKAELALSIDRFRAFLEEVLRVVRRRMEDQDPTLPRKEPIGKTPSELLDLLNSLITVKERELFQKLFNFVSVEGSHTTSATTEEARLARNLTIEIAWYLLSRVGQTSTAPPSSWSPAHTGGGAHGPAYAESGGLIGIFLAVILWALGLRAYRQAVAISRARIQCPACAESVAQATRTCPNWRADLRIAPEVRGVAEQFRAVAKDGRHHLAAMRLFFTVGLGLDGHVISGQVGGYG